ncbi:MAG: hypothetical protein J6U48_04840 [Alistipes sp.]|nr:hypothetical protein [Alistipes sp.]
MDKLTELRELQVEYNDLLYLDEECACRLYNTDTKSEAITILQEQIDTLIAEIDLATEEEEEEIKRAKESDDMPWIDPAFRTMADFNRMRV